MIFLNCIFKLNAFKGKLFWPIEHRASDDLAPPHVGLQTASASCSLALTLACKRVKQLGVRPHGMAPSRTCTWRRLNARAVSEEAVLHIPAPTPAIPGIPAGAQTLWSWNQSSLLCLGQNSWQNYGNIWTIVVLSHSFLFSNFRIKIQPVHKIKEEAMSHACGSGKDVH